MRWCAWLVVAGFNDALLGILLQKALEGVEEKAVPQLQFRRRVDRSINKDGCHCGAIASPAVRCQMLPAQMTTTARERCAGQMRVAT